MKMVNKTNGTLRYDTEFKTADNKGGGDCGDIPAGGSKELDYANYHDIEVQLQTTTPPIAYKQVQNNAVITVTSSLEE